MVRTKFSGRNFHLAEIKLTFIYSNLQIYNINKKLTYSKILKISLKSHK